MTPVIPTPIAQGSGRAAQPAAAPAAPTPVAGGGQDAVIVRDGATNKQIYDALRNQRRELVNQLEEVQDQRENIAQQLRQPNLTDADKAGLQQRLATTDHRLVTLDLARAEADAAVARQAAVPGSIMPDPPRPPQRGPPEEVFFLTGLFMFIVVFPLTVAYARRIWRRGAPPAMPQEIYDRFTRVEQSLDAIALEVERVGEGQRFLTRMQSQQAERALGAGPVERVEAGVREKSRDVR